MSKLITPLIVCGGAGTRLWPASRENWPKQFLPLFRPTSTFQETLRRVSDSRFFSRPIIVTNAQYRFLVVEQLAAISVEADILLEPMRRDSGPAIVAGATYAARRDGDAVLVALAADHVIDDPLGFIRACMVAADAARGNRVVAFGVRPNRPATEYGYIRPGRSITSGVFDVEKFVEKPTSEIAARHIAEGFLWNSGNFVFRAAVLLEEYRRFESASSAAISDAVDKAKLDIGFIVLDPDAFERAEAKSIDYAVMERTDRAAVMPVSYTWSDVGSWQAAWEMSELDTAKNAAQGSAVFVDSRGCYVSTERQLVTLLGLEDVAVIATDDALLVAQRERSQELKRVVQEVKDTAPKLIQDHLTVHRPWGSYRSVDEGARYQVKRIVVRRGGRLSLQLHHHRAEHWIVVRGTARVTIDDTVKMLHENESIYVPIGAYHRLENPGRIDLELIEVQTGSYLGEDDIVRIEDDYHRCQSQR